jgi:hypothetical protein
MSKIEILIEFKAFADFKVDEEVIKKYAKEHGYNWKDEDGKQEAVEAWVYDNAYPDAYHLDYSGSNQAIALGDISKVNYEVPEEAIASVKILAAEAIA